MREKNKEKPIIFSGEMVRAVLEGRKTQTRRIIKPQPTDIFDWDYSDCELSPIAFAVSSESPREPICCPYGRIGDRLWVRETWADVTDAFEDADEIRNVAFRADNSVWDCYGQMIYLEQLGQSGIEVDKWKSPRFMPKYASRITLEITNIRVERIQEISWQDAAQEGVEAWGEGDCPSCSDDWGCLMPSMESGGCAAFVKGYIAEYKHLWKQINGAESWDRNDWVWVLDFKRV